MKDIAGGLEEKRSGAGGGENRRSAHHAKCRLSLIALALFMSFSVPVASAQESAWIEPSGRYSLGFEALGWTATPNLANAPNILAFVRNDSPRDDRMRLCFVREDAVPYSRGSTQATANQILDRWDEARLSQVVGSPVTAMAHARIGSVSAIDYRLQRQDLEIMARFFMVEGDSGMDQITISCTAPAPFTEDEVGSINAVFDSLHLISRESQ